MVEVIAIHVANNLKFCFCALNEDSFGVNCFPKNDSQVQYSEAH